MTTHVENEPVDIGEAIGLLSEGANRGDRQ
jgi:hypothetical protein